MSDITQYITPELMVLIPVLYLIGESLKRLESFDTRHIPIVIGIVGILIACIYEYSVVGFGWQATYTAIIQGILCAGASVYANQLYKQEIVSG